MTPAGKLSIALYHTQGKAFHTRIVTARPTAARVLLGKTPAQVLTTVPLLFSVCGNAQTHAALQACRSALGVHAEPQQESAREMLVQLEALREYVWRILLDWPGFVGLEADKKALAAFFKFDKQFKLLLFRDGLAFNLDSVLNINFPCLEESIAELETLIEAVIFKSRLSDFHLIVSETDLLEWLQGSLSLPAYLLNALYRQNWESVGRCDVNCIPAMDSPSLSKYLQQQDLSDYSRLPHWQGRCYETTVLNRQFLHPLITELLNRYHNGLLVRMVARLLEVSIIPAKLRHLLHVVKDESNLASVCKIETGIGLGQVQAGRGVLIHHLALQHGRVQDYCIVAPTEWNFHPAGLVAQGLKSLQAKDSEQLRRQAELLINAVDPCVQYELILSDCDKAPDIHA